MIILTKCRCRPNEKNWKDVLIHEYVSYPTGLVNSNSAQLSSVPWLCPADSSLSVVIPTFLIHS